MYYFNLLLIILNDLQRIKDDNVKRVILINYIQLNITTKDYYVFNKIYTYYQIYKMELKNKEKKYNVINEFLGIPSVDKKYDITADFFEYQSVDNIETYSELFK